MIVASPGGGYVVAGRTTSGYSGDKTESSRGSADYWLLKIDENGNKIWDRRFGGSTQDGATAIVTSPGGGYVVAGWSLSDAGGDKSEDALGLDDYWLVKIDENGNKIWDRRFGGIYNEWAAAIIVTPADWYVIAGYTNSGAGGDISEDGRGG